MIRTFIHAALLTGALTFGIAQSATITVTSDQDPATMNTSDGECTLREAIQAANTDETVDTCTAGEADIDEIVFDASVTNITLNGTEIKISDALTIDGGTDVTIDANKKSRIFNISEVTTINYLILRNGKEFDGGAIRTSANLTIGHSTLSGNSALYGGAIYADAAANVTITKSTLSGNSAYDGGAIFTKADLTITNSTLSGNSATIGGGAIYDPEGEVTITNSTLSGNSIIGDGGAIFTKADLTISNSTLSGNSATFMGDGGAIFVFSGDLTISNSTLSGNSATFSGGAVESLIDVKSLHIFSSLLLGNTAHGSTDNCEHSYKTSVSGTNNLLDATCGSLTKKHIRTLDRYH